jgi:hypothetical protein
MNRRIQTEVERRGITRLCHFTPSRNLVHIATGGEGILATGHLADDERSVYNPTDLSRLDGHPGHVCCSIEYPNAWYFEKARSSDVLFRDWVVLFLSSRFLWTPGTRFCPRNAASGSGRNVAEGEKAFEGMFAPSVAGSHGHTFVRSSRHLLCCPTDEQAELLIPDGIGLGAIIGVAVSSEEQARNEHTRMSLLGVPEGRFTFIVAPTLYDKRKLSQCIRAGRRPLEVVWCPGATNEP